MCQQLRILQLLLLKNLTVRIRHFIGSIFELFLPGCIIVGILYIRSNLDVEPIHFTSPTYFPILTKNDLVHGVSRSLLHLYYKPENPFTEKLMNEVGQCMTLPRDNLFGFESEEAMLRSFELQQANDLLISVLAIDFDETSMPSNLSESVPNKLSYKIRSSFPLPDRLFDFESTSFNAASDDLIEKIPLVTLQMCLNDAFIDEAAPAGATKPTFVIQKMLYPPYDEINPTEVKIQNIIKIAGGLIFFATIYLIPMYVSGEKISGVNTLLKMNGVKSYQNFLSWFMSGICFGIIPVLTVTVSFYLSFTSGQKAFYHHSNYWIIGLALFINFIHIYAFCVHVASYFSKAWLAQVAATTLPILINVIAIQLDDNNIPGLVPYLGFICPTVAAMRIFDEFNRRENQLIGVNWDNVFESTHPTLTTTGSVKFIMLSSIGGIIFHFLLALYFDAVLPNKYGVRKSPLFFWKAILKRFKPNKVSTNYKPADANDQEGERKLFETVPDGTLVSGIQLINLKKYFTCGWFQSSRVDAIRGITLDFYEKQITALLGQNGAGKTTTFSILSGLTAPSEGTVTINGKDVSDNLDEIRSDLGVCPQENMMFPDLTVLQQLRLIGKLKRKDKTEKELEKEVDDLLNKLNIKEKSNVMPETLSGGQKRRLCLGMALIGNASTLFLDEPTSGMDPETSRATWDIILEYRKHKTIIITTHNMEEADVLGDRIAIMQSGRMKCYGTPMFLKNHYGKSFHKVTLSVVPSYNEVKIRSMVGSGATIEETDHGRVVIGIPLTNSLPDLLDDIESQKEELGITGLSVETISLEEVFLKSTEEENEDDFDETDGGNKSIVGKDDYVEESERTWQRICVLLAKKITYFKRDMLLFLAMILGVILAAVLSSLFKADNPHKLNSYSLDLSTYKNAEVLIYAGNGTLGETYKKIIEDQSAKGTFATGTSLSNDLLQKATEDVTHYETRMIIASEFNSSSSPNVANGLYSGKATLSAPITVNAMSNLALKTVAGDRYSIVAEIGDLPQSMTQNTKNIPLARVAILKAICLFAAVFFHFPALFVKHPLLENNSKVKKLQQMAGVSSFMYWATTFICDYTFYFGLTGLSVLGIFLVDFFYGTSMTISEIGILFLLFLLFGVSVLLLAYVHSFMKKQFHVVYSIMSGVPILLTVIFIAVNEIMTNMGQDKNANLVGRRIFLLEPHISFILGYMRFREIAFENSRCQGLPNILNKISCNIGNSRYGKMKSACCGMECRDGHCKNPLPYFGDFQEKNGIEEFVIYLLITPIILVGILWLLEQQVFAKLRSKMQANKKFESQTTIPDEDVLEEERIVCESINKRAVDPDFEDENVFLVHQLKKCYGKLEAAKNVSFRVKKNECFGLLGVNGAGKSTTFKMLVGEEIPTIGNLRCGKYNIRTDRKEYLAELGYCPQNDALIPYFNAEEHLSLLARLRGLRKSAVKREVDSWIKKLQLTQRGTIPSSSYSGGNKRRLNIAMALIGGPKMVLLDEPTTGVDPSARRSVWTVLQDCQKSGQAIILTSHSMEECEALCDRLVIMVQGRLLCIGPSQKLKKRFGAGFNIIMKINLTRTEEDFANIKKEIETALTCKLLDEHPGYLFYHVTNSETTWVKMFRTLNCLKLEHSCIEDFTVSSSTLEQLFMQFANPKKRPATSHSSGGLCNV